MTRTRLVRTAHGQARLHVDLAPRSERALLVLGHGAGGGVGAPDLAALADALPARGISVVRVEQPWRVAGRRIATAPASLDAAWVRAVAVAGRLSPGAPLIVGGRSAGARVACRCVEETAARGVLALAFPLHPPNRPERSRAAELAVAPPLLVVQGERDALGTPQELRRALTQNLPARGSPGGSGRQLVVIPAADHGFGVPRRGPLTSSEVASLIVEAVVGWMGDLGVFGPGRESSA